MNFMNILAGVPNFISALGNSPMATNLISSLIAKLTGKNLEPELIDLVLKFVNEVKEKEGFASVSEVLTSEKYAPEIQNLIKLVAENTTDHQESITLGADSVIVCKQCGYHNRTAGLIEKSKSKNTKEK